MFVRRSLIALAISASAIPAGIAPAKTEHAPARAGAAMLPIRRGLPSLRKEMRRSARAIAQSENRIGSYPPILQRIAACESGGNPRAIGGGGAFHGLFQFTLGTWQSVGGSGDPVNASIGEQYKRAAMLLARSGAGQWPVCGA